MSGTRTVETSDRGLYAARQLRRLRKARGFTVPRFLTALAALDPPCVLSPSYFARVERCQTRFPLDRAPAFARVLDVPLSDLLGSDHLYPPSVPTYRSAP